MGQACWCFSRSQLSISASGLQVGLLIDRLTQFLAKLKFTLTVLVTSWTEKKQRRQSAGTLLALNASLCPLLLAVVTLSALLSAPLLPLFTLPIFLVGFPRPQRSWPGPVGTACPCPDSIFYQQMSGSLAKALRTALARGSLGQSSTPLLSPNIFSVHSSQEKCSVSAQSVRLSQYSMIMLTGRV